MHKEKKQKQKKVRPYSPRLVKTNKVIDYAMAYYKYGLMSHLEAKIKRPVF